MSASQEKQPDQQRTVAVLAKESQVPVDDVAKLYEREHAALATGAHITTFLHILALRNVQEILHKRALESPAKPAAARPLLVADRLLMPPGSTWATAPAVENSPRP